MVDFQFHIPSLQELIDNWYFTDRPLSQSFVGIYEWFNTHCNKQAIQNEASFERVSYNRAKYRYFRDFVFGVKDKLISQLDEQRYLTQKLVYEKLVLPEWGKLPE